jgi:hypothetical protein
MAITDPNKAVHAVMGYNGYSKGITIREHFAAIALQGILANKSSDKRKEEDAVQSDCITAVAYADFLIQVLSDGDFLPENLNR